MITLAQNTSYILKLEETIFIWYMGVNAAIGVIH